MNTQQSKYINVFKTKTEQISVLQLPEFNVLNFRNILLNHYKHLMENAPTKEARDHARRQYELSNPLTEKGYEIFIHNNKRAREFNPINN